MKNIRKIILGALTVFAVIACEDPDKAPIITFDSATKGAYVRLIEGGDLLVNLLDVSGSSYTYSIEFVDLEKGGLVNEYILAVEYDDNDASNGDNSTTITSFRSFSTSDFAVNENGFVGIASITITANELLTAAGITEAEISPGDNFNLMGRIIMNDGSERNGSESSSAVNGAAFRGHFDFTMPASCPSDLSGTYPVVTTIPMEWNANCAAGTTFSTTVELIDDGAGVYSFADWSFGGYGECYNCCTANGDFFFTDVCTIVTINNAPDSYGDEWVFTSSVSGNELTIAYANVGCCPNEQGVSVITFPDGIAWTLSN